MGGHCAGLDMYHRAQDIAPTIRSTPRKALLDTLRPLGLSI